MGVEETPSEKNSLRDIENNWEIKLKVCVVK